MCKKKELFRIWKQSRNQEYSKKYCEAKKDVKRVVHMTMDKKTQEAVKKVDSYHDGHELFRISKQGLGRREMVLGLSTNCR